jgi:hypothetical protein
MNDRAIKIIRWILLVPLTIAVPALVMNLFMKSTPDHWKSNFSPHSFWHSFFELAPYVVLCFLPAFLTIPTACVIAPSHRKIVSLVTLVFAAGFCLYFFVRITFEPGFYQTPLVYSTPVFCAQLFGLAVGFVVVLFVLTRRSRAF